MIRIFLKKYTIETSRKKMDSPKFLESELKLTLMKTRINLEGRNPYLLLKFIIRIFIIIIIAKVT